MAAALSATRIFGVFFAPAWFLELWVVGRLRRCKTGAKNFRHCVPFYWPLWAFPVL